MLRDLLGPPPGAPLRIIGLMSGTSADGVDAALVETTGAGPDLRWRLVAFHGAPFPSDVRNEILGLQDPDEDDLLPRLAHLHALLGEVYAEACAAVAAGAGGLSAVHLVGLHGQTVYHATGPDAPQPPVTLQIGEAAVVAERTGLPVVSNFRARDVAAGGTGAPLVPLTDWLLLRSDTRGRLCLNLGGIANLTAIPRGSRQATDVLAFDTGPGNMVLDALAARASNGAEAFDRDGRRAAAGRVIEPLLTDLLRHPFLVAPPPKSCGREEFGAPFAALLLERLKVLEPAATMDDALATAARLTARVVAEAARRFVRPAMEIDEVLVGGGGVRNPVLMAALTAELAPLPVGPMSGAGIDPAAREALAFALLANETVHGRPGNLPGVTGARHPVVLGAFVPGGGVR